MAAVGVISRTHPVTFAEWQELVGRRPELRPVEPREILNPFTGTGKVLASTPGRVSMIVGERSVGGIEPSHDFALTGDLVVFAPDGADDAGARAAASEISRLLNADLLWFE